jgi:hypothetical protein
MNLGQISITQERRQCDFHPNKNSFCFSSDLIGSDSVRTAYDSVRNLSELAHIDLTSSPGGVKRWNKVHGMHFLWGGADFENLLSLFC